MSTTHDNDDVEDDLRTDAKMQKKREIDQLSLELLSNSSHYKKYLAKSEPSDESSSTRLLKNKERVQSMLTELLDDYDGLTTFSMTGNGEIQRKFKICVDKILDFLEWTSYKDSHEEPHYSEADDVMFGGCVSDDHPPITKSFWGKKVNKYF